MSGLGGCTALNGDFDDSSDTEIPPPTTASAGVEEEPSSSSTGGNGPDPTTTGRLSGADESSSTGQPLLEGSTSTGAADR
ncbi:MAG: hypothetical protein AAGA54_28135, partial [Myxococcota bacterium]